MTTPWRLDNGQIEILDEAMVAVLKAKTIAERVAMIGDCNRTARALIRGHLRSKYPDWDEGAIEAEIARRMLLGTK